MFKQHCYQASNGEMYEKILEELSYLVSQDGVMQEGKMITIDEWNAKFK